MIFNFFKSKKNHQKEITECFICCSEHERSDDEEESLYIIIKMITLLNTDIKIRVFILISVFIIISFYQLDTISYPLLSLAEAYGCECHTSFAHNKCLITIDKCPTCRKISKPNLYVKTRYDYYLKYLLRWLKKDPSNISKLNLYMIYYLIFLCGSTTLIEYNSNIINKIIPPRSKLSIVLSVVAASSYGCSIFMLSTLNDYLKKYWLYNANTNKYDVFHQDQPINNISAQEALDRLEIIRLRTIISQLRSQNNYQRIIILRLEQQIAEYEDENIVPF